MSLLKHIIISLSLFTLTVGFISHTYTGDRLFLSEVDNPKSSRPAIVLLHSLPSSSHQYREVLVVPGGEFHLLAPDHSGYGDSSFPDQQEYDYSSDNIENAIDKFLIQHSITRYALMTQDFGESAESRIAARHPKKVKNQIVTDGHDGEEGAGEAGWERLTLELEEYFTECGFNQQLESESYKNISSWPVRNAARHVF